MPLRMRVHDREPIGLALRRFKKLLERSGIQKELRKRKYYEKPCEARRRAELRKQSAIRKARTAVCGWYPIASAASSTRCRVAGETFPVRPFRA